MLSDLSGQARLENTHTQSDFIWDRKDRCAENPQASLFNCTSTGLIINVIHFRVIQEKGNQQIITQLQTHALRFIVMRDWKTNV